MLLVMHQTGFASRSSSSNTDSVNTNQRPSRQGITRKLLSIKLVFADNVISAIIANEAKHM